MKVADRNQLKCEHMIKVFVWKMQGTELKADLVLLLLSGSDMVLGI